MKRLQKQNLSSKRSLSLQPTNASDDQFATPPLQKKRKPNYPWLVVPECDENEKTMKEAIAQLRKVSRSAKVDHSLVKELMKVTYPLRRKMVLAGIETVEAIVKSFPALVQAAHVSFK